MQTFSNQQNRVHEAVRMPYASVIQPFIASKDTKNQLTERKGMITSRSLDQSSLSFTP